MKKLLLLPAAALALVAACSTMQPSCSSDEAKSALIEAVKDDITSYFASRPAFRPEKLIPMLGFTVSDVTTDQAQAGQPTTCSANVSIKLPDAVYARLSQPLTLQTFQSFGVGGLKVENGSMISRVSYQVRKTEDTHKLMVSAEGKMPISKGLMVSAIIGLWE